MFHYRAYGLTLHSAIELPELEVIAPAKPDVVIGCQALDGPLPEGGQPRLIRFDDDGIYLAWPLIGRFRVTVDGAIAVSPLTRNAQHLRFALLGPVLAACLHQRGEALLHGSAVKVGSRAHLFLGEKGAGKSTLAAAFAANGCPILNDDIIPLSAVQSAPSMKPGFPGLKLSPAARGHLLPCATVIDPGEPEPAKVMVRQPPGGEGPVPIGAIFLLDGRAAEPERHRLPPRHLLLELLKNSYVLKFGEQALAGRQGSGLFRHCALLGRSVPAWKIIIPEQFDHLRRFADMLAAEHERLEIVQ